MPRTDTSSVRLMDTIREKGFSFFPDIFGHSGGTFSHPFHPTGARTKHYRIAFYSMAH